MNQRSECHTNTTFARKVQASSGRSYDVRFQDGLLDSSEQLASLLGSRKALLVTTPTVATLYRSELERQLKILNIPVLILACNERRKTLDQVKRVCQEAYGKCLDRRGVLISLGGGVCTDIVTVAASLIRRGVQHIRIPTTLVGQIDAGIGIKGAVNFLGKKNYLGSFYPPAAVLIDPTFLQTLPALHLSFGLAEIIKIALVRDQDLFHLVEQCASSLIESGFAEPRLESRQILASSVSRMLEELETNIYEDQTYKRLVDFGHTFSPLLEAVSGFHMSHSEAVAVDMALSCAISCELGLLGKESRDRIISTLVTARLPIYSSLMAERLCMAAMEEAIRHRGGAVNLVLLTGIGQPTFLERADELSDSTLKSSIKWLAKHSRSHCRAEQKKFKSNKRFRDCLVFDVGGTNLRAALYHPASNSLSQITSRPTPNHWTMPGATVVEISKRLLEEMHALSIEILEGRQPSTVSVAFAGPTDLQSKVLAAPTVWGASEQPIDLIAELASFWPSTRLALLNDISAAGYRHLKNEFEDFCIVTVSSGIGNKVFVKGRPLTGPAGRGGEIGHVQVDFSPDAPVCDCGGQGHLGAISSGRGTLALARRLAALGTDGFANSVLGSRFRTNPNALTNADIVSAFQSGDAWTRELIQKVAVPLGQMLAAVHLSMGVERFVIIGGFALALGEPYRLELVRSAANSGWLMGQDWNSMIELGHPDDNSGLLGAGRFVTEFAERQSRGRRFLHSLPVLAS
jgi:3-dehydroquinate synthetase/predicted NBD/HSP70 family sugar kinase